MTCETKPTLAATPRRSEPPAACGLASLRPRRCAVRPLGTSPFVAAGGG